MTATQTKTSSTEITDWALLRYHNKCVARAANWANGCKTVTHLQVDNESSLLAIVLKVACFAIATIGFLLYDVVNEVWRGSFGQNQIVAEPPKPIAPEAPKESAKTKAPPPTPKKHTPHKPVDGTVSEKLDVLDEGLAKAFDEAGEERGLIMSDLVSIKDNGKTLTAKIGHLETSLAAIQEKINGLSKQVIDEITPLIDKPRGKQINFGDASILPEGTPRNWRSKPKYPQTPDASKTPLNAPSSITHGSLAEASLSQLSEIEQSLPPDDDSFSTPPLSNPTDKETITMSKRDMTALRSLLAEKNLVIATPRTKPLSDDSTTSVDPKRENFFEHVMNLTPILPQKKPNTKAVDMSVTPVQNRRQDFLQLPSSNNARNRTPIGVSQVNLSSSKRGSDTATTPSSQRQLTPDFQSLNFDEDMQLTPNHSTITAQHTRFSVRRKGSEKKTGDET